jgi:hypothetical protein
MKSILKKILPKRLHPSVMAQRAANRLVEKQKVLWGPFKSLFYSGKSVGSQSFPKTVGVYELELHRTLETIISSKPSFILIIGAAEGYYVAGLASRCPDAHVVAYEQDPLGRELVASHCEINQVAHRVEIRGYCDHKEFLEVLSHGTVDFLLIDIEGGEYNLLSQEAHSLLLNTVLLVELHPWVAHSDNELIIDRFLETHHLQLIESLDRTRQQLAHLPLPVKILSRWFIPLLSEHRPQKMQWLLLRPKM